MNISTSTKCMLAVTCVSIGAVVGYVMLERHRAKNREITKGLINSGFSQHQSWAVETSVKKLEVLELMPDEKTMALATVAGGLSGAAATVGHRILPFAGGIAAGWATDKLTDLDYQLKYAKEKHPLVYAMSSVAVSLIPIPSLKTPTPGRDRSHCLPQKWGVESIKNPLNVSSVPTWFHKLTDSRLPWWATNTIGLIFRVTPPIQVAGVMLLRKFRFKKAVTQCKEWK